MGKRDGRQKSEQNHAQGEHGDKTHAAFIEGLHGSEESEGSPRKATDVDEYGRPSPGRHRLKEDRDQHDLAEKNSEANRTERHDLE
jgi:hypothetical protein